MSTKIFVVVLAIATALGCTRNQWGEKPAAPPPSSNKIGSELRCLKDALPTIQNFLKGDAQPQQVSQSWQCFAGALQLFKNRVRGNPQGYQATELRDFFQDYFLKEDVKISKELLEELMRLKQVFVGGENQLVTRAEVQDLIQFAGEMETLSLELLPSMKILANQWSINPKDVGASETEFELARMRAEKVLLQLSNRIESKGQSYKLSSLITLFQEFERLYNTKWSFVQDLQKALPLVQKLKKTLMGSEEGVVLATEWRQFGMLGVRSYLLYLRYQYFIKNLPEEVSSSGMDFRLAFRSIDDLVVTLGSFISEKPSGRLEVTEVQDVLKQVTQTFPDFKFSEDLLTEVMKIKVLLVGGSLKELSSKDFATARQKLNVIRGASELYYKWGSIFAGTWDASASVQAHEDFAQAEKDLQRIAGDLGSLFETKYELSDFQKLLKAVETSFPPKPGVPSANQKLDKYLGFAVSLKNLILNDWLFDANQQPMLNSVIQKDSWKVLFETGAQVYSKYLRYQYFLKTQNWARGSGLKNSMILSSDLHQTLETILKHRKNHGVRSWELAQVFSLARRAEIVKSDWKPEFVQSLVDKVVQKVLTSPEKRLAGTPETEITKSALNILFKEVDLFLQAQSSLDQLLNQKPNWQGLEIRKALDDKLESSRELSRILETSMAMSIDSQGRVFIGIKENLPYDEASMIRLNIVRMGTRLLIRSYAGSLEAVNQLSHLTNAEVDLIFTDWRPVGIELGLLDPANERFAKNRFLEANLFTPFSDGNDQLSFQEGSWLLGYIISGVKINSAMTPDYEKSCGKGDLLDVNCVLQSVEAQLPTKFGSLPDLQASLAQLDAGKRREMFKHLFTAIGWVESEKVGIKKKDLGLFPHTLQYIESIMKRTDLNGDGIIHPDEAWTLEPTFRPLLAKVSGFDDEHWLKALFAYILVYGDAPEGSFDELFFAADWVNRSSWPIAADRPQLAKILGVLTSKARSAP